VTFLFWHFDPWDVATSHPVLLLIAAVAVAALVVGHFPVIGRIPALAPYVVLSRFVSVLAAALLMFLIGFRVADNRAERAQMEFDLNWHRLQLEQQEATAKDAERLKDEAQNEAREAKGKLDDYRARFGDRPDAVCAFTLDDLERLRALRRSRRGQSPDFPRLREFGRRG
jgi:hypothetical protein